MIVSLSIVYRIIFKISLEFHRPIFDIRSSSIPETIVRDDLGRHIVRTTIHSSELHTRGDSSQKPLVDDGAQRNMRWITDRRSFLVKALPDRDSDGGDADLEGRRSATFVAFHGSEGRSIAAEPDD